MNAQVWYGARTIYLVVINNEQVQNKLYEERVIVLRASSFDEAIAKAEVEAVLYCSGSFGITYLGYINVFKLFDEKIGDQTEVFSFMRESHLSSKEYIDKFFDTGHEKTRHE